MCRTLRLPSFGASLPPFSLASVAVTIGCRAEHELSGLTRAWMASPDPPAEVTRLCASLLLGEGVEHEATRLWHHAAARAGIDGTPAGPAACVYAASVGAGAANCSMKTVGDAASLALRPFAVAMTRLADLLVADRTAARMTATKATTARPDEAAA